MWIGEHCFTLGDEALSATNPVALASIHKRLGKRPPSPAAVAKAAKSLARARGEGFEACACQVPAVVGSEVV